VVADTPGPIEDFESWLLHRVAQAGEVPADPLIDLQAEFDAARERPQDEGYAAAVQHIADLAAVPEKEAVKTLGAIEARPKVTRDAERRFVEAWPVGQRTARRGQEKIPTGEKGARPWKPTSC
jgi:hypothetical protein